MDELVILNKPKGLTSRDVVNKLNHILGNKKIGHTGTLDPLATGVLVCLCGKYTKLVDLITAYDKEYIAEIEVGIETDTGDITGNVIKSQTCKVTEKQIIAALKSFPHKYIQTIPKYSAVKINGKRLYEYARENIEIDLPKREVSIYKLELLSFKDNIITFKAFVSKGTYIRSLISDICKSMNIIGTMKNLTRTKQGMFKLEDANSLEDIMNNNYKSWHIKDFLNYPIIEIPEKFIKIIKNGGKIPNEFNIFDKVIFTYQDKEIAIYQKEKETLKPYIMF